MSLIADSVKDVKISPTFVIAAKARELRAKGEEVFDLSIGDTDCDTPQNVKEAAHEAIRSDKTKYTAVDGIAELKEVIHKKYLDRIGKDNFSTDNIIVSSGGKHVLYNCFLATLNEGDEVIVPVPYWVSYSSLIKMCGGTMRNVPCHEENNFKVKVSDLREVINEKSKWLLLNSPNNPTGVKYSREELREIADCVKEYPNLYILSDDIYEDASYDDDIYSIIDVAPEMFGKIFIMNGISKAYGMTGWRIGYGLGDKDLIKAMKVIQSQSLSCPCSVSQYAALEALAGDQTEVQRYVKILKKRRELVHDAFKEIDGLSYVKPAGAFYFFPNCSKFMNCVSPQGKIIKNDIDLCNYLVDEARVLVVPGSVFGGGNHFRLAYSVPEEVLKKALEAIRLALGKLK